MLDKIISDKLKEDYEKLLIFLGTKELRSQYVSIGFGNNKLVVYVQDDYLHTFFVEKLEAAVKEFSDKEGVVCHFHKTGKVVMGNA